jgi:hypothetical protein
VELLGEKTPVTLVARPAAAAQEIIAAGDKLHDATKFRAQKLFMQVCTHKEYSSTLFFEDCFTVEYWAQWGSVRQQSMQVLFGEAHVFVVLVMACMV